MTGKVREFCYRKPVGTLKQLVLPEDVQFVGAFLFAFPSASCAWWSIAGTSPLWEFMHEGCEPEHWYEAFWLLIFRAVQL